MVIATPVDTKQSYLDYIGEELKDEFCFRYADQKKYKRCLAGYIYWLVLAMAGYGIAMYQSSLLLTKYQSYPIETVLHEGKEKSVFPDVTICNIYPLTNNNPLKGERKYFKWFDYRRVTDSYFEYCGNNSEYAAKFSNYESEYYNIVSRPTQYFINFPIQDFRNRSYRNTTNLITDCKFLTWINNNITCLSPSTIEVIWNAHYDTCYTFKVPESERRNVRFLSAILYIDNFPLNVVSTISPDVTQSELGVRAMIHPPGTVPDFNSGISVGPGTATTISISVTERKRLGKPYNSAGCKEDGAYLTDLKKYRYSYDACLDVCKQTQIIDQCGCLSPDLHSTDTQKQQTGSRICGNMSLLEFNISLDESFDNQTDVFHFEQFKNYTDLEKSILLAIRESRCIERTTFDESKCDCVLPCNEGTYTTSTSASPWPHISRQLAFYKSYIKEWEERSLDESLSDSYKSIFDAWDKDFSESCDNEAIQKIETISGSRIEDNFLKINFVLDSPYPLKLSESPAYEWTSYIADLGGVCSVWIGMTFLTYLKMIEVGIRAAFCRERAVNDQKFEMVTIA